MTVSSIPQQPGQRNRKPATRSDIPLLRATSPSLERQTEREIGRADREKLYVRREQKRSFWEGYSRAELRPLSIQCEVRGHRLRCSSLEPPHAPQPRPIEMQLDDAAPSSHHWCAPQQRPAGSSLQTPPFAGPEATNPRPDRPDAGTQRREGRGGCGGAAGKER